MKRCRITVLKRHFDEELAKEYDVPLYPFFLDGVAMKADLNLQDGMHPNAKGVDVIVERITPSVVKVLK